MLVAGDLKSLEWQVAAFLSQDQVMLKELWDGVDPHARTGEEHFKNKGIRVDWKIFNFRMIYGGTPYSFYMDPVMPSFSKKEWQAIYESFFAKYTGLNDTHMKWIKEVNHTGKLQGPTGRIWQFSKYPDREGCMGYKPAQIKNYPVQGTATADFVPLAMVEVFKRVKEGGLEAKLVNQVHDEIIYDCPEEEYTAVACIMLDVFEELPRLVEKHFEIEDCNIPLGGEVKFGNSWLNMERYKI